MVSTEYTSSHTHDKLDASRFDHKEVRLDYDWEVIYWCLVLQCTKEDLENAVRQVGTSANDIRKLIQGN